MAHGRKGAFVVVQVVGVVCFGGVGGWSTLFVADVRFRGEGRGVVKHEAAVPNTGMAAVVAKEMIGVLG